MLPLSLHNNFALVAQATVAAAFKGFQNGECGGKGETGNTEKRPH